MVFRDVNGPHLSVSQRKRSGEVRPLGEELQQRRQVPTLHGVVQLAGFRRLPAQDVAALGVFGHNVLLSGIPGRAASNEIQDLLLFWRLKHRTHMSLCGKGLTASFGRPASMMSLNLVLPMLTASCLTHTQKNISYILLYTHYYTLTYKLFASRCTFYKPRF